MNVKAMRRIDGLVGNLVCSILAAVKQVATPFARPRGPIKKVVVMKFFGMGSIVVASPCLAALRDLYPGVELHFVTFKGNRELIDILGVVDRAHYVDPSTPATFARSTLQVVRELRAADVDLALDLEFFAKFPLALSSLAGIRKKAGFYLQVEGWRRTLLDVRGVYNHYHHTREIFLSLVYLLATEDPYFLGFEAFAARYAYPRFVPSQLERAALRKKLGARLPAGDELVVINPNTSPDLAPEARKWPEERYAQLAERLLRERPRARVAFVGAPGEKAYVERVAAQVAPELRGRASSLAGELSLRELLVLFAEAALVVSNDSGPMHLACLVDAPTVGLFFADSPTLFAPLGSRVRSVAPALYSIPLFTVYNGKDMSAGRPAVEVTNAAACTVSVDQVLAEARALLAAVPETSTSAAGTGTGTGTGAGAAAAPAAAERAP
ncbi:MAG TPA: glycosyltransferase family 9 protein [Kofleriaceae bacterium]|nr:glycosyltransferase family 9 protein [Kofleriaceae bacterium]